METVADFLFLGSKITADVDCSHEIKKCSLEEKNNKQSILMEINPEYTLEGLMIKLKLQYFDTSCKKTLMLRKIEGRRKGGQ